MQPHPVKIRRQAKGWSIKELAKRAHVNANTISLIENRSSEWKTQEGVALLLAEALECEVYDLFALDDISPYGRPPSTGRSLAEITINVTLVCPNCRFVLPASGVCGTCD